MEECGDASDKEAAGEGLRAPTSKEQITLLESFETTRQRNLEASDATIEDIVFDKSRETEQPEERALLEKQL
jgi:hypothetical protein